MKAHRKRQAAYDSSLISQPHHAIALERTLKRARRYRAQGEYEQSRSILEEALDRFPGHHGCYAELGFVYYRMKAYDQAERFLRIACEDPFTSASGSVYRTRIKALARAGRLTESRTLLASLRDRNPDDARLAGLAEEITVLRVAEEGAGKGRIGGRRRERPMEGRVEEFPATKPEQLVKFVNYDEFIGWDPRPAFEVEGKPAHEVAKRSRQIERDGARYQPRGAISLAGPKLEFFGDSLCFCNEVEANETVQYYLEAEFGIGPCKNYGVGNYGADQALLRAHRRLGGNGSVAVLHVSTRTLLRIGSVYKHYIETGNVWAVKPRFVLGEDDGLRLIRKPFVDRSELSRLSRYADFFRHYDDHYEAFAEYKLNGKEGRGKRSTSPRPNSQEYIAQLAAGEQGRIFALIARDFCRLAASRGCRDAFVVLVPFTRGQRGRRSSHREVVAPLMGYFSAYNVPLYDFGDAWFALPRDGREKLCADGTHLSAEGNRFCAGWIAELLDKRHASFR